MKNQEWELTSWNQSTLSKSVGLVSDPATNRSLFESEDAPESKSCEQIIGELIAALVAEGKEDMVKDVIKLKKKLSGGNGPEEAPEEAPTEESWKQDYSCPQAAKSCRELLEVAMSGKAAAR